MALDLSTLPNFCSHEHWGLTAIRSYENDTIPGRTPNRPVGLCDFVNVGPSASETEPCPPVEEAYQAWVNNQPRYALDPEFQCMRRGIVLLHGLDIEQEDVSVWQSADIAIRDAYANMHSWIPNAMAKANFSKLIRPVAPTFYAHPGTSYKNQHLSYTDTLMRMGPLFACIPMTNANTLSFDLPDQLWWPPEAFFPLPPSFRQNLYEIANLEPTDAKSWRLFIERLFDLADAGGSLGLKDMIAKARPLTFQLHSDTEVAWSGVKSWHDVIVFQDWLMHECCKQANDRHWAYQIHVGTSNLTESSPTPLYALAKRYTNIKFVLLHCWPFIDESAWLAKHQPNIYLDACWQPLLNPDFFRRTMETWLGYVPITKICCGHDAHSVESAVGSSLIMRDILQDVLMCLRSQMKGSEKDLTNIARFLLDSNASKIYYDTH